MAESGTRYRVGVDIGGTFTDFCAFDERTRQVHALKVLVHSRRLRAAR